MIRLIRPGVPPMMGGAVELFGGAGGEPPDYGTAPTVDAGGPYTGAASVSLNGTVTPGTGVVNSTLWSVVTGGGGTFANAAAIDTTFTPTNPAVESALRLTANWGAGFTVSDDATMTAETGGFTPASLFASGEEGGWYDPSDLSTMFQDTAGTQPVTADGQTVALIRDKSGRANHASQETSTKRPLYKTSGGLHWLQFDGVDDALVTPVMSMAGSDKMSMFCGVRIVGTTNQAMLDFGSSGNGRSNLMLLSGASPTARATLIGGDGGVAQITTPSAGAAPVTVLHTALFDIAGAVSTDEIKLRQNGVLGTQNSVASPAGTGAFANRPFALGDTNGTSVVFPLSGNIYGAVLLNRIVTAQEIADTEAWIAQKTGVTLP